MKQYFNLTIVCLSIFVASCSKKDSAPADPFDPSKSIIIKNQAYGSNALQKADIYLPANRSSATKTMVLIHGGFWSAGDKAEMDTLIKPLQIEDPSLAIININYRLADGNAANQFPVQMEDFSKLLDYLDSNASKWHIGKHYALTGISAGGHLALMYAYKYDLAKRVKVIASVLGPTNLADPYYTNNLLFQQIVTPFIGKPWSQDSTAHKNASPVGAITSSAPATFMAYGGADQLVPVSNPDLLKEKLVSLGVPYTYYLYPNEAHELSVTAILIIINKLHVFFNQYL
jgi:acetyl esterase/lipase